MGRFDWGYLQHNKNAQYEKTTQIKLSYQIMILEKNTTTAAQQRKMQRAVIIRMEVHFTNDTTIVIILLNTKA